MLLTVCYCGHVLAFDAIQTDIDETDIDGLSAVFSQRPIRTVTIYEPSVSKTLSVPCNGGIFCTVYDRSRPLLKGPYVPDPSRLWHVGCP